MASDSDIAKLESIRERISRLSTTELDAVDRLLELLKVKRLRRSLGEAVDAALAVDSTDEFCGFNPFPSRCGIVTDELINRLRE